MEEKVFKVLQIGNAEIIGSSAINSIKYASDVDLQEHIYTEDSYEDILKRFQKKFKFAKETDGIWITDFKCGVIHGGIPVRWDYDSIMKGHQFIDGQNRYFTTCLQQESIIKMDVIALVDGKFTEYSENYYFVFPNQFSTQPNKGEDLKPYLINDYFKYVKEGKRFKALKRLFGFFKHSGNQKQKDKLIKFFNSPVGKFNQQISSLRIILDVMDNTFKPVKLSDIKHNIKLIIPDIPDNYKGRLEHILGYDSHEGVKKKIEAIVKVMEEQINEEVKKFMDANKFNIR
jgi:hypothetical protein